MSSAQVIADSSTRVIAIANQKGGVGKTTTTVSLGAALADEGQRVLLIDLDPQANASTGLGINPRSIEKNMYDVLLGDTPLEDTLEPAADVEGLFVAPSSLDLAGAEIELVPGFNRERRLLDALAPIVDDYDFVFIDCPPSLGLLTINALVAATEVLVPIQCEYYALEGVGQLVRNVELVRKSLNPALAISTIVLVMFDARTKLSGQVVDEVRAHFGDIVCDVVIPRVVRLSEAPSYGQPITVFDPENRGAVAYRDLAKEVLGEELDLEQPWDAEIQAAAAEAAASEGDAADETETDGDVDVVEPSETVEVSEAEESSATGESSQTGTDVPSPPTERADDAVQTTSTEDAPAQPVEAVQATEAPEASDPVPSNPMVQSDESSQSIDSTPSNPMTRSDSSNDFAPEGSTVQSVQNTANTHQFEGDR